VPFNSVVCCDQILAQDLRLLHLYFNGEGGHDRRLCCSAGGTGVAPSSPGFTVDDSAVGNHDSSDVAAEDVAVLAVATSILLLDQYFLKQVRTVYTLLRSTL
jgi:hypothetical protein